MEINAWQLKDIHLYIDGITSGAVLLAPWRRAAGRGDMCSGVMSGE